MSSVASDSISEAEAKLKPRWARCPSVSPLECDAFAIKSCISSGQLSTAQTTAQSKIASSASVSSVASFPEYDLEANTSMPELKSRMSELIKSKGQDLVQACKNFDRRSTNKIPKSQLRQVIRMFCLSISAAQFDSLCEELEMNMGGKINYNDFFSRLSGVKLSRISQHPQKVPDNLPIYEVEVMLKERIKDNLRNVIRSFWLFDINKDGFIQKTELRRIIRNYCFELRDDLYNDLWKLYEPSTSGIINYKDFLIKLGISVERYKKYMPSETVASSMCWKEKKKDEGFNKSWDQKSKRAAMENRDDPVIQGLPLEEIMAVLIDRLHRRYGLLKETFKLFDSENTGEISLSDFRGVINFFVLAMSTRLFNRVMRQLHVDMSGGDSLSYQTFLEDFCQSKRPDPSTRISENLDVVCAPIVQRIKNRVLNPEARLHSVFTKINTDKEWQITRPELKKALELGLDFKMTDEEFKELTAILDPGNTNIINCVDIIHLFEDSCATNCIRTEGPLLQESTIDIEKYETLRGRKLYSKLKHHLNKNISNVEKAILICDGDQSGFILPEKLRDILSGFCFPLSEDQFEDVMSGIRKYENKINYHEFFTVFKKKPGEEAKKWIEVVDKLVDFKSKCPPEMPVCEVEEMLRECIQSRKTAMLIDFKSLDVCNVGVALKDDVRNVLSKFAFRFTDKQFETLWENFPRNRYNQLIYDKFLEEYSSDVTKHSESETGEKNKLEQDKSSIKGDKKVSFQDSGKKNVGRSVMKKTAENRKTAKEILYARAPHLKKIFETMEPTVIRNFRNIRYHLRRQDPKVTDEVDFVAMKRILAKLGIYFSKEEEFHVLENFDPNLTGKINYRDFLRIFVWYA